MSDSAGLDKIHLGVKLCELGSRFAEGVNIMGNFGSFYKGDKKKPKREKLEKQAEKIRRNQFLPKVEILGKKGK